MKFKTEKQRKEFDGDLVDPKLKMILKMIDQFAVLRSGMETTITELMRSQAEQDDIYKDSGAYRSKPWLSVHQVGKGADIRTNWNKEDSEAILTVLNLIPYRTAGKTTAIRHDVGKGDHIHVQV